MKFEDLTVISKETLQKLIEAAGDKSTFKNTDALEVIDLIDEAYEAGKLDKELSNMFDYPKLRYLNHEFEI